MNKRGIYSFISIEASRFKFVLSYLSILNQIFLFFDDFCTCFLYFFYCCLGWVCSMILEFVISWIEAQLFSPKFPLQKPSFLTSLVGSFKILELLLLLTGFYVLWGPRNISRLALQQIFYEQLQFPLLCFLEKTSIWERNSLIHGGSWTLFDTSWGSYSRSRKSFIIPGGDYKWLWNFGVSLLFFFKRNTTSWFCETC